MRRLFIALIILFTASACYGQVQTPFRGAIYGFTMRAYYPLGWEGDPYTVDIGGARIFSLDHEGNLVMAGTVNGIDLSTVLTAETDPQWAADKASYATLASPVFTGTISHPQLDVPESGGVVMIGPKTGNALTGRGVIINSVYSEVANGGVVIGADEALANRFGATVIGGWLNQATGECSTSIGDDNIASGQFAATIGGSHNNATQYCAVAIGGENNHATHGWSIAMGSCARAVHTGAMVIQLGDGSEKAAGRWFDSEAQRQFAVAAHGGVRFELADGIDFRLTTDGDIQVPGEVYADGLGLKAALTHATGAGYSASFVDISELNDFLPNVWTDVDTCYADVTLGEHETKVLLIAGYQGRIVTSGTYETRLVCYASAEEDRFSTAVALVANTTAYFNPGQVSFVFQELTPETTYRFKLQAKTNHSDTEGFMGYINLTGVGLP